MNFKIVPSSNFSKELKRLARKYPRLKYAIKELTASLSKEPFQGAPLGRHCYKIRLSSPDKTTGKSGGFRLITHVRTEMAIVFMLSIYDKSAVATIKDSEIRRLIESL